MTLTIRLLATINALVLCAAGAFAGEVAPSMRTHTLAVGDKKLAYLSTGVGPAVVIVHGVGGHKEDWEGVATALAKTHRVYALDMLGFGGSSKNGDDLSMPVQADAIEALLDHHHIRHADLVGNSVGGWVAATMAASYPERVRRLVLIDAAGFKAMFEGPPPVNFDPSNADEMQKLIDITINSNVANTPGLAQRAYDAYVSSGEKAISTTWSNSLFRSPRLVRHGRDRPSHEAVGVGAAHDRRCGRHHGDDLRKPSPASAAHARYRDSSRGLAVRQDVACLRNPNSNEGVASACGRSLRRIRPRRGHLLGLLQDHGHDRRAVFDAHAGRDRFVRDFEPPDARG